MEEAGGRGPEYMRTLCIFCYTVRGGNSHLPSNMLIILYLFHQELDSELAQSVRIFLSCIGTYQRVSWKKTLSIICGPDDPSMDESQTLCPVSFVITQQVHIQSVIYETQRCGFLHSKATAVR